MNESILWGYAKDIGLMFEKDEEGVWKQWSTVIQIKKTLHKLIPLTSISIYTYLSISLKKIFWPIPPGAVFLLVVLPSPRLEVGWPGLFFLGPSLGVKSRILLSPGPPTQAGCSKASRLAPCSSQDILRLQAVVLLRLRYKIQNLLVHKQILEELFECINTWS